MRLFDRGPGRPFARVALRWVVMVLAIPIRDPRNRARLGRRSFRRWRVPFLLVNVVFMVAALLVAGIGAAPAIICAVKREETRSGSSGRSRVSRGRWRSSLIAADAGRLRVVDLLAYRRELEAVREWPYDTPALTRFVILLLLPIVSWILSAMVERLVDAILTR